MVLVHLRETLIARLNVVCAGLSLRLLKAKNSLIDQDVVRLNVYCPREMEPVENILVSQFFDKIKNYISILCMHYQPPLLRV